MRRNIVFEGKKRHTKEDLAGGLQNKREIKAEETVSEKGFQLRRFRSKVLTASGTLENDERKLRVQYLGVLMCDNFVFPKLDFVTVKYVPIVYVASRHFIILFIFLYINCSCSN